MPLAANTSKPYSATGLIQCSYSILSARRSAPQSLPATRAIRLIRPMVLSTIHFVWLVNVSPLSSSTPKYFTLSDFGIVTPFILISGVTIQDFLRLCGLIMIHLVLVGSRVILHFLAQSMSEARSSSILVKSASLPESTLERDFMIAASSANFEH